MRQSAVSFEADGLTFEGVVAQSDDGAGPWPGVVICHPHPLHGGNMENNVVLALALGLAQEGFVTLRFNFRGVGGSQGEHTEGEKESQEVLAALELIKAWPDTNGKTGLIGYSFGTSVILRHGELHDEADAIEEERRLFYVGITRAEDKLSLSWARQRRRAGDFTYLSLIHI